MATVRYRNTTSILFAFNPNIYEVEVNEPMTIKTHIECGSVAYTDERMPDANGYCRLDVSEYMKALFADFDKVDISPTSKRATIRIEAGSEEVFSKEYTVIFGSIYPGETFNPSPSTTHWWKNMPQTFSWYHAGGSIAIQYDGEPYEADIVMQLDNGIVTVPLSNMFPPQSDPMRTAEFQDMTDGVQLTTFTMEFDGTFQPGENNTQLHRFIVHDDDRGVFIRWLDRHGMWQYWMMKAGATSYTDAVYGELLNMITDTGIPYDVYVQRMEGKTAAAKMNVCAPSVDKDTHTFLCGMCSSPHVSMLMGGLWMPIQIAAGTHTWAFDSKRRKLQDFEISIVLPEIPTQKL